MNQLAKTLIYGFVFMLVSCNQNAREFDATGSFEAIEITISSEANGILKSFTAQEGQRINKGAILGYIDTTQLHLYKKQLIAQKEAVLSKKPNIAAQLSSLNEQLKAAQKEKNRFENLLKSDAATEKQVDDLKAQIDIINGNIRALKTQLTDQRHSIQKEIRPIEIQIEQIDDKINKSLIVNPLNGTNLAKYVEAYEQVRIGQALYKIANTEDMTLRIYLSGNQLPKVKIGQKVKVFSDNGEGEFKEDEGEIYWISDKAEFTPKSIQTKDERANKVYAAKVRVKNDGSYKIGMYGEVNF